MEGSRHVGHLSIQISGQNMKVVRPDGQIIQGPNSFKDHSITVSAAKRRVTKGNDVERVQILAFPLGPRRVRESRLKAQREYQEAD